MTCDLLIALRMIVTRWHLTLTGFRSVFSTFNAIPYLRHPVSAHSETH
jgi:hypothetical protein